jgi:hypothetical protein
MRKKARSVWTMRTFLLEGVLRGPHRTRLAKG